MASRLRQVDIGTADGFSLNVSNYIANALSIAYGERLSRLLGGKHFIIDTSRNGMGGNGSEWCNVPGQSLGREPTTDTGNKLVDAYLWVKVPGESDGTCNGGPSAGSWWPEYALALARSAQTLASR
jgi:endoglucanase